MGDPQRSFGRYYEELEVGAVYKHWAGRTVSEHDNTLFALLSRNQNPLFLDQEYARTQPLGRCPDTTGKAIANLAYESVEFLHPLFPGDSLYTESEVLEKRGSASKADRGVIGIETRAYNQNDERILVLRPHYLAPKGKQQ